MTQIYAVSSWDQATCANYDGMVNLPGEMLDFHTPSTREITILARRCMLRLFVSDFLSHACVGHDHPSKTSDGNQMLGLGNK